MPAAQIPSRALDIEPPVVGPGQLSNDELRRTLANEIDELGRHRNARAGGSPFDVCSP